MILKTNLIKVKYIKKNTNWKEGTTKIRKMVIFNQLNKYKATVKVKIVKFK